MRHLAGGDEKRDGCSTAQETEDTATRQRALEQTGGNVTHAARLLKISRKGLQLKMKELGLRERDERSEP